MHFGILGPLRLGDGSATVTAARERTLLGVLLLNPDRVVAVDELVDAVWGEDPPSTARGQLQSCVSRLRRTLVTAGFPPDVLATDPAGYLVRPHPPVTLDATVFAGLVEEARAAVDAERLADAARAFRSALALWRGPALAAITAPAVRRGAAVLDEQRMLAVEDRIDVELCLGRGGELLGELTGLVERHPLRERLRAQLMLALRANGRPADALEVYRAGREILAGQLGIEPGPRLREAHRQILGVDTGPFGDGSASPAGPAAGSASPIGSVSPIGSANAGGPPAGSAELTSSANLTSAANPAAGSANPAGGQAGTVLAAPPRPAPRCLPRAIADFTGHAEAAADLLRRIQGADPGRPAVHAIDGMAGSGKTTLAVHVATAVGGRYPDAHLFIDLHGHSDQRPLTPAAALATLLRQLGVPGEHIPNDLEDRLVLWRSELAHRRVLVVLDNAVSTAQVAPLLPTGSGCLALVTSRRRLVGLDGVRPRSLAVITPEEAVELLARIAGPERVSADPSGAAEVVRRCGYLPLAIRLAGARLAHRPRWRVADLVERLGTDRSPLAEFAAEHRRVADAFALSYAQVTPGAQRAFRLLGCYPGRQFDALAAAALTGTPLTGTPPAGTPSPSGTLLPTGTPMAGARELLDELVDAHLVEALDGDRYRLHDLVREYAAELAATTESDPGRGRALDAMFDFHLHACARISGAMESSASRATFVLPEPFRPDLVEAAAARGRAWLDERRPELPALVRAAFEHGRHRYCWQLTRASWWFMYVGGHLDELVETHALGLRAAEALADEGAIAMMRNYLASAYFRQGRFAESIELLEVALELRRRIGDRIGQAGTHKNLGVAYAIIGRIPEALANLERALSLHRKSENLSGLADVLNDLGFTYLLIGRYADALAAHRRQLLLVRQLGRTNNISLALGHIGAALSRQGHHEQALRRLRVALRMKEAEGNRFGVGELCNELGVIERIRGRPDRAVALHRRALAAMLAAGDRAGECTSRNCLGRALFDVGEAAVALRAYHRALHAATKIQFRYGQASALDGIASCLLATDPAQARSHWTRALTLFDQISAPERHEVRRRLAELELG